MTDIKQPQFPGEELGFINHIARMSASIYSPLLNGLVSYKDKAWVDRVVIWTDSLEVAELIQSRLPKEFHSLPPISLQTAIDRDERTAPEQLIYVNTNEQGRSIFTLTYSVIAPDNNGEWLCLRDKSDRKWGWKYSDKASELDITSSSVLNGVVDINVEIAKAKQ